MNPTLIDFLIGVMVMNSMPHIVVGLMDIRFLSAFGYSPRANIAYGLLCLTISIILFHFKYGIRHLPDHGILTGAISLVLVYLVTGRFLYKLFHKK